MKVGVCSNPSRKIFQEFLLLEIQKTFYQIIREETAKKWRQKAPEDFEFTIKCFQGITHSYRSPTWKKSNIDVKEIKDKVGELRLNDKTLEFWEHTMKIAKILKSKVILVQLPASFKDSEENIKRTYEFFEHVERDKIKVAIELRGWKFENIEKICKDLDLIDVFDPLIRETATPEFLYIRLHGKIEKGRINYKYQYTDAELRKIKEKTKEYDPKEAYILFNNVYMFQDAKRFLEMIKE